MAPNGTKKRALTGRQEVAALALASGRSLGEAARESGAGERSLKRWLAEQPAFARRVGELRAEMTARALGVMVDGLVGAAATLRQLCLKAKSESVKLGAARAVLELGVKLRESVELGERMAQIESRLNGGAR